MNQPHNNPQLDQFISSKLKSLEIEFEQQVWLEMEDSLGTQSKGTSIPKLNPKYLIISAAIVVSGLGVFFLVRSIVGQNNNDKQKILVDADSMQVLQADSSKIIPIAIGTESVVSLVADSVPMDTIKQSITSADTVAKLSVLPKTDLPAGQTGKKKTKTSSLAPTISDTGFVPEIILPPDTAKKNSDRKEKIVLPSSDSSKTTNASPKKSGKKGKQKTPPAEQPKTDPVPPVTKPDSLK